MRTIVARLLVAFGVLVSFFERALVRRRAASSEDGARHELEEEWPGRYWR